MKALYVFQGARKGDKKEGMKELPYLAYGCYEQTQRTERFDVFLVKNRLVKQLGTIASAEQKAVLAALLEMFVEE